MNITTVIIILIIALVLLVLGTIYHWINLRKEVRLFLLGDSYKRTQKWALENTKGVCTYCRESTTIDAYAMWTGMPSFSNEMIMLCEPCATKIQYSSLSLADLKIIKKHWYRLSSREDFPYQGGKTYMERQSSSRPSDLDEPKQPGKSADELADRVKCTFAVVASSSVMKRRPQLTIKSELLIGASKAHVFDIVISHPEGFWEWHNDRSDPNIILEFSPTPQWPTSGASYRYRMISPLGPAGLLLGSGKWETGFIEMVECQPPDHALMREHQDTSSLFGKVLALVDWRFEEGTNAMIKMMMTVVMFNFHLPFNPWSTFEFILRSPYLMIKKSSEKCHS